MKKALVFAVLCCITLVFSTATSAQPVIHWNGNGTDATGACNNITVVPGVIGQNWLFVLTSATGSDHSINTTFDTGTQNGLPPSKTNRQTVQFTVNTTPYALLLSASAQTGTANSVLTVSHCEVGVVSQWCSPGYWRNADDYAWEGAGVDRATATYSLLGSGAPALKAGSPSSNPLLQAILDAPNTYGAAAYNAVGDYLSDQHPFVNFNGVRMPNSCPINNGGYLPTTN
jgi:hypothetical protein